MATDSPPSAHRPAAFSPGGPAPITMTSNWSAMGQSFLLGDTGQGDGPRRVDQPDVAERLREVAEELARAFVDLLGQQPDIVGVLDGPFEHLPGLFDPPRQG